MFKFLKRSMAASDAYLAQVPRAQWSDWRVEFAVSQGYKINPWVFRAVSLIARQASTVPWVVFDKEGAALWEHPTSKMLAKPNPHYTRQQLIEMLVAWLELAGNAYIKRVFASGRTAELWPISPDRLAPVPSKDPASFIQGYARLAPGGQEVIDPEYNADTVIHLRFIDPSNPYLGISPLCATGKSVDLDNEQLDWNTAVMQNRAVPDGVFSFKAPLQEAQALSITDRIKERFSGKKRARAPLVIGSDVTYQRMSLSPQEMDFNQSRKANREEILATFGVPPQLVGIQDASTYNNFSTSMRIFWEGTVIPVLDLLADAFNAAMAAELSDGQTIGYDTSGVRALQENEGERAKTAKTYHDMGVPVATINEKLMLGLTEYEGWDKTRPVVVSAPPGAKPATDEDEEGDDGDKGAASKAKKKGDDEDPDDPPPKDKPKAKRSFLPVPLEQRSVDKAIKLRDKLAEGVAKSKLTALLKDQGAATLKAIEERDPLRVIEEFNVRLDTVLSELYETIAIAMAKATVRPRRAEWEALELREEQKYSEQLMAKIKEVLLQEQTILTERSLLQEATANFIIEQVAYGINAGWPPTKIHEALMDTGAFSPERALRIARTVSGTATSIGQMAAGEESGATHKQWLTSGADTRPAHVARDGETVLMKARFSAQIGSVGPRFPLDPEIDAADRINCRCFMTFQFNPEYSE